MQFSLIEVIKTKEDDFFIEWDMGPDSNPGSVDDYDFEIYWSRDQLSGFLVVTDENDDPIIIDGAVGPLTYQHALRQYDFNQDNYYKVKAIPKIDPSGAFFSSTVFVGMYNDGVHEVIKHAEGTLYEMYHGEPCYLIKRKSFGARCPTCWSSTRQQRMRTHCDTCHGTGFVTGYYQPIDVQISFDSDPKKSDSQKEWENVFDTKRARMSNYPLVRPKDLIVNKDDYKRYVISHVETTKLPRMAESAQTLSKQNYIVSQLLTLEELNPDDNEYFLDVENIPPIPQGDEGQTGSTLPFFNDHKPATVDPPLTIDDQQHIEFLYESDDFEIVDGKFTLKDSAMGSSAITIYVAGEIVPYNPCVVAVKDDGTVMPADVTDLEHKNRVVGVALNLAAIGMNVYVQSYGKLSNVLWDWEMGKSIFFDDEGRLTQDVPDSGLWIIIGKPLKSDTIEIDLGMQIIRPTV